MEEVFERQAPLFDLRIGNRMIRTTAEHPFWVDGRGWTAAKLLMEGDLLISHHGLKFVLGGVSATGAFDTVYNLRVADYHTYFIGAADWGFSIWAHNAYSLNFKRWQRGDAIDKPLPDGSAPPWEVVQSRYWKNRYEASKYSGEFSASNLERMNRGSCTCRL